MISPNQGYSYPSPPHSRPHPRSAATATAPLERSESSLDYTHTINQWASSASASQGPTRQAPAGVHRGLSTADLQLFCENSPVRDPSSRSSSDSSPPSAPLSGHRSPSPRHRIRRSPSAFARSSSPSQFTPPPSRGEEHSSPLQRALSPLLRPHSPRKFPSQKSPSRKSPSRAASERVQERKARVGSDRPDDTPHAVATGQHAPSPAVPRRLARTTSHSTSPPQSRRSPIPSTSEMRVGKEASGEPAGRLVRAARAVKQAISQQPGKGTRGELPYERRLDMSASYSLPPTSSHWQIIETVLRRSAKLSTLDRMREEEDTEMDLVRYPSVKPFRFSLFLTY